MRFLYERLKKIHLTEKALSDFNNLDKDPESLAEGVTAFRSAHAWAKIQRDAAIAEINSRWDYGSSSVTLASSSSDSARTGPLQHKQQSSGKSKETRADHRGPRKPPETTKELIMVETS